MAIFANFGLTLASYLQITVASKWTIALASLPSRHRLNEFPEKIADERKELQVSVGSVHVAAGNGADPRKFDNPQELFAAATRSINTGGGKGRAISRAPARDSRSCARQHHPCTRRRHRRFRTCRRPSPRESRSLSAVTLTLAGHRLRRGHHGVHAGRRAGRPDGTGDVC